MSTLVPFLWFDTDAEVAARYYVSVFPGAKFIGLTHFPARAAGDEGTVMTASFELGGQRLVALNGNRRHPFSPATSLRFHCANEKQAAALAAALADGGQAQPGGWVKDRFGVSWQIGVEGD